MNRTQRRKQGITEKRPIYQYDAVAFKQQVLKEIEQAKAPLTVEVINNLYSVFLMTLHDKFGFGKKRLNDFVEHSNKHFDCINAKFVGLDDIHEWCKEKDLEYQVKLTS